LVVPLVPETPNVGREELGKDIARQLKIIKVRVGRLELAKQLGSGSQACRAMGFSQDRFYCFKELDEKRDDAAQAVSKRTSDRRSRSSPPK